MATTQKQFVNLTGADALAPGEVRIVDNPVLRIPHIIIVSQSSGDMRPVVDQIGAGTFRVTNPSPTESCACVLFVWFWFSTTGVLPNGYTTQVIYAGDLAAGGGEQVPTVLSRSDTPPGVPLDGDRYLVIATAGGAWTGHEDDIAEWEATSASWVFTTPTEGDLIVVEDEQSVYIYHVPTGWELTTPLLHDLGSSTRHSAVGHFPGSWVEPDGAGGVRYATNAESTGPSNVIYVDTAAGNDNNAGTSWVTALATLEGARVRVKEHYRNYIVTRGAALTITTRNWPWDGFKGECLVICNDAMTEIGAGTVLAYTKTPAKVPKQPEFTLNGGHTLPIVDADIRNRFYEIVTTAGTTVFKAGKYDAGTYTMLINLSAYAGWGEPDINPGAAVRLLEPSSTITLAAGATMVHFWNTKFVGFKLDCNSNLVKFIATSGREISETWNWSSGFRFGVALGEIKNAAYIEFGAPESPAGMAGGDSDWQDIAAYLAVPSWFWAGPAKPTYMPGFALHTMTGQGNQFFGGQIEIDASVWDPGKNATYVYDCNLRLEGVRMPDRTTNRWRINNRGRVYAPYSELSCVWCNRSGVFGFCDTALSPEGYDGAVACLLTEPGAVVAGHANGVLSVVHPTAGTKNRPAVQLVGTSTHECKLRGGYPVAAGATPLAIIRGGNHEDMDLQMAAGAGVDRGNGPLYDLELGANAELIVCKGTNTNAGAASCGAKIGDGCVVEALKAQATATGPAGQEVVVGTLPPVVWPVAGTRTVDLAALANLRTV